MKARVLIVEDELATRVILTHLIESRGHAAACACSAEEALEALSTDAFDLVLMDLSLPGISGLEALGRIRRSSPLPVAVMSGLDDEQTRRDAELLGADSFLPKPVDPAALDALLARASRKRGP